MSTRAAQQGTTRSRWCLLLHDRSGAITAIAMVLAPVLIGALWHVVRIGQASMYRQELDASADATAYTSAVYHARGMNVVAMMNIVMASTVGAAVSAKALDHVIGAAYYTSRLLCAASGAADPAVTDASCEVAREAAEKTQLVQAMIEKGDRNVDAVVRGLSGAQREVAATTPWLASLESAKAALAQTSEVQLGAALSPSMVASGTRAGLPVAPDEFAGTCGRGGMVSPELIQAAAPPRFAEYIRGGVSALAARAAGMQCEPPHGGIAREALSGSTNGASSCAAQPGMPERIDRGAAPTEVDATSTRDAARSRLGGDACVAGKRVSAEALKRTMQDERIPLVEPEKDMQPDVLTQERTGKKLAPGAVQGNEFFQVYAVVNSGRDREKEERGAEAPDLSNYAISQAEFYYDQTPAAARSDACRHGQGSCGLAWSEYRDNVLWNMRWRARLRFFRMPAEFAAAPNVLESGVDAAPFMSDTRFEQALSDVNAAIAARVPQTSVGRRSAAKEHAPRN